jgi:hypothetical protein
MRRREFLFSSAIAARALMSDGYQVKSKDEKTTNYPDNDLLSGYSWNPDA